MREALIVSGVRTAVGKFGRALREMTAPSLGAVVIKEALSRAKIEARDVQEVIMGNVIQAGVGQNPARQAAVRAGIPYDVGAVTVNKVCGSGLKAAMIAAQAIRAGDYDVIVAGGMESMSQAPYLVRQVRWGVKYGDTRMVDAMLFDGLWDAYNDFHMGVTGEIIAEKYGISRSEADEFAYQSHMRAASAKRSGAFKAETIPLNVTVDGVSQVFQDDECIREDTSPEKLAQLPPVFKAGGLLTAGNSSQLSDGAAALVIMSREKAEELGVKPMAKLIAYETGGSRPEFVMEAPIPTCQALLARTGLTIEDMDLVEHNEAYATASLAVARNLVIPLEKLNVRGGAIALGHPIGCSGARILVTLLYALKDTGKKRGLATLCLGGGNAVAAIVELV